MRYFRTLIENGNYRTFHCCVYIFIQPKINCWKTSFDDDLLDKIQTYELKYGCSNAFRAEIRLTGS